MHGINSHHHLATYTKATILVIVLIMGILSALYIFIHRDTIFSAPTAANSQLHLLQSGWDHMPGTSLQPDGLQVTKTDRAIVQQDGSPGMTSPSVNLYGTHLYADGDYTLTATLSHLNGSAILRFYSAAPLTQDEFYTIPKSAEFIISGDSVTMNTWNSNRLKNPYTQQPTSSITRTIKPSSSHRLILKRINGQFIAQVDDTRIAQQRYRTLFTRELWFGLSAKTADDNWTLQSLDVATDTPNRVYSVNTTSTPPAQQAPAATALQALATAKRTDFQIGAATALAPSVSDDAYRNILYTGNFGSITTENALKWQFIHPTPLSYDFTDADNLINLAKQHNLAVHGHSLVFGEANPAWVQNLPIASATEKAAVEQTMTDHIQKTVEHFKGQVASWDVVNEPLSDDDEGVSLREHIWFKAMGESYIATAFQTAHQSDPGAKLYINDFGLEADGERWDVMLALVTKLKASGVPIDGVGFQAHVYERADKIDASVLRKHIRQLANLGLLARISEIDVYSDDGPAVQAEQYRDVFATCFAEPNCTSWTTWGVSDRYNLYLDDNQQITTGQDYLWDQNMQPTAAVTALQALLRS